MCQTTGCTANNVYHTRVQQSNKQASIGCFLNTRQLGYCANNVLTEPTVTNTDLYQPSVPENN